MKVIYCREEVCITCRLCEAGCIVAHSPSRDILRAFKEEYGSAKPRILVEENGGVSTALACRHCTEAECLEACSNEAMHRHPETGAVVVDQDRCVGCWMCIMACPFGAIKMYHNPKTGEVYSSKCDLCPDREVPACVQFCPNQALFYEDRGVKAWNT